VLYQLPEHHPQVTVVSPDNSEFWTLMHVAARGRYALVLGDPTAPAAAIVVVGSLVDLHRYLDPFDGGVHRDLMPALHEVRAGLTAADWDVLQQRPEPARPVPVPADMELITLAHTGLRVAHDRLDITGYRELPTVDGVAFTATLRLDQQPVGLIQNEGVGGATTFYPNASAGFGHRDLDAYAHASRTPGGFRATDDGVLDDLITETLTARRVARSTRTGRSALRLLALLGGEDHLEVGDAEATLVRTPADRDRLIAQLLASGAPKPDEWWQLWTGDHWDDLTPRPATHTDRPDRQPARQTPFRHGGTTMHTPALTFDPTIAEAWLREPSDTAGLTRADSLGIDDDTFGRGQEGFLSTIDDVLTADPHGLSRRADIAEVMLWRIPDGDILDQGALITVDLNNGLRLASLHQDIKDFADHDQRGIAAVLSALAHIADQASLLVRDYQNTHSDPVATSTVPGRDAAEPDGDESGGVGPVTYTEEQVAEALNQAADDILDAVDAGDQGLRDAMNLIVNAATAYLTGQASDLSAVIEHNYDADYPTVLSWIEESS
jgi:hypothetical protein